MYVKRTIQEDEDTDDDDDEIKYVAKVKSVCLYRTNFYHVDFDNQTYEGFNSEPDLTTRINVKQLVIRDDIYYVLTELGTISGFDFTVYKHIEFSLGSDKITKLFFNCENTSSPVYALTSTLELYDITDYRHTQHEDCIAVGRSVLGIYDSYIIFLPQVDTIPTKSR